MLVLGREIKPVHRRQDTVAGILALGADVPQAGKQLTSMRSLLRRATR